MKVFREARFKGLLAFHGSLSMPHLSTTVQVYAEKKDAFVAKIKGAKGLLISQAEPYERICRSVQVRFEAQLTPWEWVDEEGRATVAPDSTETHSSDAPNAPTGIITLCGMVVTGSRLTVVKNPPSCTECSAILASRPQAANLPPPKKPNGADPKLMHARSSQGAQSGIVDTLCRVAVNESYTVSYSHALKGHGKKITCPSCSTCVNEILNSKAEAAK